jgi:hypothetical protein
MRFVFALAALAALSACNQGVVTATLAPGAARACTGQSQVIPIFLKDTPQLPPTQTEEMMQNFSAARAPGGGWLFTQTGRSRMGEVTLTANVGDDGAVTSAQIGGAALSMVASPLADADAMNELAMSGARGIPERLLLGRTFKLGDDLFPPGLAQETAESMFAAMGMPPGVESEVAARLPLTAIADEDGRRVLRFTGNLTMNATGPAQGMGGQQMNLSLPAQMAVGFDAATGLMRDMSVNGEMTVNVDGQRAAVMRMQQTLACTINPS